MSHSITIDISEFHKGEAKLKDINTYIDMAVARSGRGQVVTLTGPAPVWMYLRIAHALHGKVKKLFYTSPASGDVLIFNHDPH